VGRLMDKPGSAAKISKPGAGSGGGKSKSYEGSKADKKSDKRMKEDSKADKAFDKKAGKCGY